MSEYQYSNCVQVMQKLFFQGAAIDFKKIPGNPIVYWAKPAIYDAFIEGRPLANIWTPVVGLQTSDNARFVRLWYEVSSVKTALSLSSRIEAKSSQRRWFPYNKGGNFRKWYGNNDFVVNWENDGEEVKNFKDCNGRLLSRPQNESTYFKEGLTWTAISSSFFAVRYCPQGSIGSNAGMMVFSESSSDLNPLLCLLNSSLTTYLVSCLSQTLNFDQGIISKIPIIGELNNPTASRAVEIAKSDWDSNETSWHFTRPSLLQPGSLQLTTRGSYTELRTHWSEMTLEMQRLEEENNRIFINAYGLQDELSPKVSLNEITLTCNPHCRYGGDKTEEDLEALLLADTMREFISYAVGCMFGRYALDKPGLVLANQGETIEDYRRQVPNSRFEADADNVIPMLDGEWFADDVTERFRQFLRVTFGDAHYDENLAFIEQALNPKGKRNYTLRDYMLGEFYTDHVKRYKKRPIYWLFSSPKGTFNALIYLHRYRPDTASVVLRYLRDFRAKLAARQSTLEQVLINPATSQGEKTKAGKEIDSLKKQIIELQDYENDTLYPLATANVALDLDDGVKVNYLKLGAALKKITGLDAKEED
jgi:hypothetical protein